MRVHWIFCLLGMLPFSAGCEYEATTQLQRPPTESNQDNRPNFLLIVADDLGYSDIGAFGGEIHTPNLDALASQGLQLTNFHTGASCSPTRAMLLSGIDHHLAGVGVPVESAAYSQLRQHPGYEGHLNFQVAALPELLRDAGYRTYMTGKWHLGYAADTIPSARGFDQTYVLLGGAATHFDASPILPSSIAQAPRFMQNGKPIDLPDDFYSTRDYAQKLVEFLKRDGGSGSPFFAYLAFTAPHWPLQAPEASIAKYRGDYDAGYEALFDHRLRRQRKLGLIDDSVKGQPLAHGIVPWGDLSLAEKRESARKMEVYAAMVDDMDHHIGAVINTLKELGEYDNTIILFLSDNGAEGNTADRHPLFKAFVEDCCDNRLDNLGKPGSFVFYGRGWARVSSVPNRYYKSTTGEGGIRSPAIVRYPAAGDGQRRHDGFLSVLDIAPTILDFAGAAHPGTEYNRHAIHPLQGASFRNVIEGAEKPVHPPQHVMGWELSNHKALIRGDWKIAAVHPPYGEGSWRLFNLAEDRSESTDLCDEYPGIFNEMLILWQDYATQNGVVVLDESSPSGAVHECDQTVP